MATLTNTQISVTYVGLLKTSANTVLSSTAQQITDGSGNNSILFLSTAGVGIGGAAASGKELDVTGNVQITGDLIVDNITIDGNTITSASSDFVIDSNGGNIILDSSGGDIVLKDTGTEFGRLKRTGENLIIKSITNDKDIIFKGVDNTSEITALTLDMSEGGNAFFSGNISLQDEKQILLGTGDDFKIYHFNTDAFIQNSTGDITIENFANDKDIIFKSDDGSGGTTAYLTLDGSTEKNVFSKDAFFGDNVKALFGAGSDLQIYHDSNNSVINDNGTGDLYLMASSAIRLTNVGASEHYAKFIENGAVELYHDNSKKFETTSTGTTTQGVSQINGTDAKIRCLDTADFFYTDYGRDGINAFTNTNASAPIFFKTGGTERARIDASGNLGIGINSPDFLTHIYSTGNSVLGITAGTSAFATLQFGSTSDTTRGAIEYSTSDDSLRLKTGNNSEKMRITSGGLVGIGLTPTVPLDILAQNGTTDVSGITYNNIFRLRGTDSGGLLFLAKTSDQDQVIQTTNNDADLIFGTRTGSNNFNRLHIQGNTGNVGIGIEPTKKVTVFGTGAGNATVQIEGEGGADPYINFLANNTQHFSLGIDDSDSDKFKLSKHSALGTNDYLVVDTSGNATFAGAVDTGGNITATTSGNTFVSSVSTSTWAGMKIQASDSDSAYLFLFDTSGERARIQSTSNNDIKFSTNGGGSLALTLDSSTNATFAGNVTGGNGTFTNLTINATEKLRFDGAGGHTYIEEDSNDTLIFATGGTTRLTLDTNATFSSVALFSDGNGINFGNSNAKIYGSTANGIQFNGGGSEKMRLTQAGDLGINATSPNTKFAVSGAATTGSVGTASVARFGRPTSVGTSFDQYVDFKIGRHTAPGGAFQSYTRFDIDLRDDSTTTGNNTNIMTLLNGT